MDGARLSTSIDTRKASVGEVAVDVVSCNPAGETFLTVRGDV